MVGWIDGAEPKDVVAFNTTTVTPGSGNIDTNAAVVEVRGGWGAVACAVFGSAFTMLV